MGKSSSDNNEHAPVTTADEIRHFAGAVADHTILEILAMNPTTAELEVACLYAQEAGAEADKSSHGLEGKSALIYDILVADEAYQVSEI